METNTKMQEVDDLYDEQEMAPLTAMALLITEWVKVYGVDSLDKRPAACHDGDIR